MAQSIILRPAVSDDARALTALALRSKAYWGYDDAFMKACVAELTITPKGMADEDITVAEAQGDSDDARELEDMFVDTPFIGSGLGARLMAHAEDTARTQGAAHIDVDADPNAQGFYEKCGYRLTGSSPSASIPGRTLPRLRLDL